MGTKKIEILWRVSFSTVFLVALFGAAIVFKVGHIQFVEGKSLRDMADSLTVYYETIEPERGNIYTENGDLLSTSLPFFEVRMDFQSEAMTRTHYLIKK